MINKFIFLFFLISTVCIISWSLQYWLNKINNNKIFIAFVFHVLYIFAGMYLAIQAFK